MIARYETPDEDGETRRARNARYGMDHKNPPEVLCKLQWAHLWHWFWNLNGSRHSGDGGPQPLSYLEIDAWQRLTRTTVRVEEIQILIEMDGAYLSALHKEQAAQMARRETARSKG